MQSIVGGTQHILMKTELAQIFELVLGRHKRALGHGEPVVEPGEEKAKRGSAGKNRKRRALRRLQRPDAFVGLNQRAAFRDVKAVVRLEAPRVQADREVIGEEIVAGEIEIDKP